MWDTYATKGMPAILKFEGGKDDDPRDPGGRTNQGVIQRVFTAYLLRNGKPNRDVFTMTNQERDEIYKTQYADKVRYGELPPGVDVFVFDGGVNAGPSQSIKWLQRALGVTADGVLGEVTMQRTIDHPNHDLLISAMADRRRAFYRGLKTFKTFGKGWLSRVDQVTKLAQAIAMGTIGPAVVWVPNGNKKADPVDFKPLPALATPAALTSGGGVGTALTTAQSQLVGMTGTPWVDHAMVGISVALAVLTAAGLAYTYWAKYKRDELTDVLDLVAVAGANDNAQVPYEVVQQYADPEARGNETGNIAPGVVTQSGRVAGDTEKRKNSTAMDEAA